MKEHEQQQTINICDRCNCDCLRELQCEVCFFFKISFTTCRYKIYNFLYDKVFWNSYMHHAISDVGNKRLQVDSLQKIWHSASISCTRYTKTRRYPPKMIIIRLYRLPGQVWPPPPTWSRSQSMQSNAKSLSYLFNKLISFRNLKNDGSHRKPENIQKK